MSNTRVRSIQLISVIVLGLAGATSTPAEAMRSCKIPVPSCPLDKESVCWQNNCKPINPYCDKIDGMRYVVCEGF